MAGTREILGGWGSTLPRVEYFPSSSILLRASWLCHHPGVSFGLRGIMLKYSGNRSTKQRQGSA